MDLSATMDEIAALSVDDRIRLVEAIWDSIAADSDDLKLTGPQRQELARRLAAHAASPSEVIPWETIKAQALDRARQ